MKIKALIVAAGLLACSSAFASSDDDMGSAINMVRYPVTEQQWVNTNTAEVSVDINATVASNQMATIQQQMTQNLQQQTPGAKWQIIEFDRTQNSSGLQQIQALAQARLSGVDLGKLTEAVKKISKPGFSFKIDNVNFSPSFAQIQRARMVLRQRIYNRVKQEITRLNKIYPKQHFVLHDLEFNGPVFDTQQARVMMMDKSPRPQNNTPAPVSSKVTLTGNVVLASDWPYTK